MKKSILCFMVVSLLCCLCVGCGKSSVEDARDKSIIKVDITTAEQIGKLVDIAIDEDANIKEQISSGYKKCNDVEGLVGAYLSGNEIPRSLENGDYYVKSENDIVKVVIATSEDEANKETEQYDGTQAGRAYISE